MWQDPEAKGLEGFFGHVRCVACRVVVKEARPETRRCASGKLAQLIHHGGQLVAAKIRSERYAGCEEILMNENAAPPNTEQGRF